MVFRGNMERTSGRGGGGGGARKESKECCVAFSLRVAVLSPR